MHHSFLPVFGQLWTAGHLPENLNAALTSDDLLRQVAFLEKDTAYDVLVRQANPQRIEEAEAHLWLLPGDTLKNDQPLSQTPGTLSRSVRPWMIQGAVPLGGIETKAWPFNRTELSSNAIARRLTQSLQQGTSAVKTRLCLEKHLDSPINRLLGNLFQSFLSYQEFVFRAFIH
jgi:hypothetical protein